ncbi:hypothetical protein [Mycobacterium sp. NPDC006124]|uniref:hypothetical protein n=1 Tax=Mycobacterium sp. NPDC006124 TaxID=3156729 RepID=UPI00339FA541
MKKSPFTNVIPGLAAVAIGGVVALAPAANAAPLPTPATHSVVISASGAGTDPLVPFGTEPQEPSHLGYVDSNHDEIDTTNGQVDLPF